jgi:hypothetical protein
MERFLTTLRENDTMQLSDPTVVRTTRMRICFAKGVFAELSDALGEEQYCALLNKYLWILGVPRRLYLMYCPLMTDGLDVGWAPGENDESSHKMSLSRLLGLRASVTRDLNFQFLHKQTERRYRFVAGTVSYKTANKVVRYEKNWDIVWT